jgi:hypothetical protein
LYIGSVARCYFYGCEIWSFTLREELRLRVFENRVWRRIFWPRRDEVTGGGENYIMRSLMISTAHRILLGDKMRRMRWTGQVARTGRGEAFPRFHLQ